MVGQTCTLWKIIKVIPSNGITCTMCFPVRWTGTAWNTVWGGSLVSSYLPLINVFVQHLSYYLSDLNGKSSTTFLRPYLASSPVSCASPPPSSPCTFSRFVPKGVKLNFIMCWDLYISDRIVLMKHYQMFSSSGYNIRNLWIPVLSWCVYVDGWKHKNNFNYLYVYSISVASPGFISESPISKI